MLRNLLIDVTGNTHRAEFCIDKLYSPDGPTGRLGLLELRAFEMPPHARMSLAQQLLLRALVARFWKQPYQPERLKRWGTELHDRFMLPHFVWEDFSDVLEELGDFGYALKPEWFAPHFEFRFPKLGDFAARRVDVELRMALEPWHVLGEEGRGRRHGALRRFVARAPAGEGHRADRRSPRADLQRASRCRCSPPAASASSSPACATGRGCLPRACTRRSALHAPLTFDLVDTWMNRSLGGCQYHVAHPGGRNYDTFPVNAYEAEARRLARFFRIGHTPGGLRFVDEPRNPDHPFTLDMRRGLY